MALIELLWINMENIRNAIKNYFDTKTENFCVFHQLGVQVEGWVKGEILYLLNKLKENGTIENYDREVLISNSSKKKCDFTVETETGLNWIELKYWITEQKGATYSPYWYFQQQNYLFNDFLKLQEVAEGQKWAIVFCVCNPGVEKWNDGLQIFKEKFQVTFSPKCRPDEFRDEYYFELLEYP